jgi:hypothetical protein
MASDAVQSLMRDNRVPEPVQTYLITSMGVDTLSRAHSAFEENTLARQVDDMLIACGYNPAGTPVQVRTARMAAGDIKQFWREASAENAVAIQRKASRVEPDAQGPLPSFVLSQLLSAWMNRYHFELLPAWKLAPNQLGRLGREMERAGLQLWLMHKLRFLPQARHDKLETKVQMGAAASIHISAEAEATEPQPLALVSQYLDHMWAWCLNLSYLGVHARHADGTKIPSGHADYAKPYVRWDTTMHYHQYAKEKATTILPDGKLPTVAQVREADEKTRLHWMRLTGPDAPSRYTLDAAIVQSQKECHHLWTWIVSANVADPFSTPDAKRRRIDGDGANLPSNSGNAKTGRTAKGRKVCKKWNDGRPPCGAKGAGKGGACPEKLMHGCDVLVADHECCGSNHRRNNCQHSAASHQYQN